MTKAGLILVDAAASQTRGKKRVFNWKDKTKNIK
jgi:hypothetical protein